MAAKEGKSTGDDAHHLNDLYKRMVEEVQDYAIILMDKDGTIKNWNKGAENIKQYTEEEIVGRNFSTFYLPEDIINKLPQKLLNEASETGKASHEGWRKRKDGTAFWGSITITALHDDDDAVIGYCKVTRDLTHKKLSEDQLRLSEERYHQMIAEVRDYAIILLSPAGTIENWNAGAEAIKGYRAEEIIGRNFEVFYTEEDRKSGLPLRLLATARDTGRATQEGWRVRKDRTKFWGSIVITALHGKGGDVIGYSKVTRDLTEKKLSDDKLTAYMSKLELQNSELEQFAYVASHDLQEPLRKIQTFSELIRENYDDRAFVDRYFDKLDKSARRMAELVKSLLNYSHLTKDSDQAQTTDVNLNTIIDEVKQDFELLIEEKHAIITCEMLPVINGSHIQLGQLFANIISNSLKFSTASPIVKIRSSIVEKSQIPSAPKNLAVQKYQMITLEDNGIGFDDQYRKTIFSLFKRLHGKQEYSGTGIGLALCKKIVENHKGFISATSALGAGTKLSIYLPDGG